MTVIDKGGLAYLFHGPSPFDVSRTLTIFAGTGHDGLSTAVQTLIGGSRSAQNRRNLTERLSGHWAVRMFAPVVTRDGHIVVPNLASLEKSD